MKKYETRLYNGNISKSEKRSKFAKVLAIGACATSFGIGYSAGYSASTEILNETEKIIEQRQNEMQNTSLIEYTTETYKKTIDEAR